MNRLLKSVVVFLQLCGCSSKKKPTAKTWLPVIQNNCHLIATVFWLKRCLVTSVEFGCFQRSPDDATRGASAGRQDSISHLAQLRLLQKICFGLFKPSTVIRPLKSIKCNKHNCHFAFDFHGRMISGQPGEPYPVRLREALCLAILRWVIRE